MCDCVPMHQDIRISVLFHASHVSKVNEDTLFKVYVTSVCQFVYFCCICNAITVSLSQWLCHDVSSINIVVSVSNPPYLHLATSEM